MQTLKNIRESVGMKQYEAAELLGITKDYLCMLEKNKRRPSNKLMTKMAELYTVAPEQIFLASNRTISSKNEDKEKTA